MLDGIWRVYNTDGKFLDTCQTDIGNEVLIVGLKLESMLCVGDILHIDEIYTDRAWVITLVGKHKGMPDEFEFIQTGSREKQYSVPSERKFCQSFFSPRRIKRDKK